MGVRRERRLIEELVVAADLVRIYRRFLLAGRFCVHIMIYCSITVRYFFLLPDRQHVQHHS